MKNLAAVMMLLAATGCTGAASTSVTSAPAPVNQPVGTQKPTNQSGVITPPVQESQGIGIAQDTGQ